MSIGDLEVGLKELELLERNGAWGKFAAVLGQKLTDERAARNNVLAPGGAAERETHLHSVLLCEELAGWVETQRAKLTAELKAKRLASEG